MDVADVKPSSVRWRSNIPQLNLLDQIQTGNENTVRNN